MLLLTVESEQPRSEGQNRPQRSYAMLSNFCLGCCVRHCAHWSNDLACKGTKQDYAPAESNTRFVGKSSPTSVWASRRVSGSADHCAGDRTSDRAEAGQE